jgi:hypothetical protein
MFIFAIAETPPSSIRAEIGPGVARSYPLLTDIEDGDGGVTADGDVGW